MDNDNQNRLEPAIYLPQEAVTAVGEEGRRMLFLTVPQLELMIKRVIADRPTEYSYRWGYHAGEKLHVLLFGWPNGEGAGVAIPEGTGDTILQFLAEPADLYLTIHPVEEQLNGTVSAQTIVDVINGTTVGLPDVKFEQG